MVQSHNALNVAETAFHPFQNNKDTLQKWRHQHKLLSDISMDKNVQFSDRLTILISEKNALKLDYQEIERDMQNFSFPKCKKPTENTKLPNLSLNKIRLKYNLSALILQLDALSQRPQNSEIQSLFKKTTSETLAILLCDYQQLCNSFAQQMHEKDTIDIDKLEGNFIEHIHAYNNFSQMVSYYFSL